MVITHHGGQCIKVSSGDTVLVFDPVSKRSTIPPTRFGADIALVSLNHPDCNGIAEVTRASKEPFAVTGPGEYEIGGVFIKGVASVSGYDSEHTINTMYALHLEDSTILFLGALADKKPDLSVVDGVESVDVLCVPIGGDGVLAAADAHALAVALEAKVVIPIHYSGMGERDALKTFLKEAGAEGVKPVEKLTLKRKDFEEHSGSVVVLAS